VLFCHVCLVCWVLVPLVVSSSSPNGGDIVQFPPQVFRYPVGFHNVLDVCFLARDALCNEAYEVVGC
jgi:hypothetical protein